MHLNFRKSGNLACIVTSSFFAALLVIFVLASMPGTPAFAQSATTGAIGGTITDSGRRAAAWHNRHGEGGRHRAHAHRQEQCFRRVSCSRNWSPAPTARPSPPTASQTYQENSIIVTVGSISTVSPSLKVGSVD